MLKMSYATKKRRTRINSKQFYRKKEENNWNGEKEALHDINGMEEASFADYVKNLLKDGDGRTTQQHIDAVRRGQQGLRPAFERKKKLAPRELLAAQHYLDSGCSEDIASIVVNTMREEVGKEKVHHQKLLAALCFLNYVFLTAWYLV